MRFVLLGILFPAMVCPVVYGDEMADAFSRYERLRDGGKYTEAIPYAKEYVRLALEKHGDDDVKYAGALNNLGALYYGLKDYENAIPIYAESLLAFEKAFGPDDASFLGVATNLGNAYIETEQYGKAEALLKRGFEISLKTFGPEDQGTKWVGDNYRYVKNVHGVESWTDISGSYRREARFIRVDDGAVVLALQEGRVINIPLDKLCEDDQIKAIARQALTVRFNKGSSGGTSGND